MNEKTVTVLRFLVLFLGLIAFASCMAAEFKKNKAKDMKLDGKLCYLPASPAFGLGIAVLIFLATAQVLGTCLAASGICIGDRKMGGGLSARAKHLGIFLLLCSWVTLGFAVILAGVGASMNREQKYGQGWLAGECYVVKEGVFAGAAVLSLAAVLISTLGVSFTVIKSSCPQVNNATARAEEKTRTTTTAATLSPKASTLLGRS